MSSIQEFEDNNQKMIDAMGDDLSFKEISQQWFNASLSYEYSYHFTWMGLPIIQYPQDILAMQEIIWRVKPDLIIETGVARGGSIIFYASLLEMMNLDGEVLGIDIDIRPHNRKAIESHPLYKRIRLLEGSSIDPSIIETVKSMVSKRKRVLISLDSNHTHEHVLNELRLYAPFVSTGSYLVVFDTVIADMPEDLIKQRSWTPQRNPKTAVYEFLKETTDFEIDKSIPLKLVFTVAPDGYLHCIRK